MSTELPIENVSALGTPDHGLSKPTRTLARDPLGRFSRHELNHREARLIGPLADEPVHYARDWSSGVAPERKSHDRMHSAQQLVNHVLGCPTCTIQGI